MKTLHSVVLATLLSFSVSVVALENTAPAPNSDPTYVQLRHVQTSGEAYEVQNLKIVRDAGTFELSSGTICLLAPVQGMITGAVFRGNGTFHLQSNDPREQNQMKPLTGGPGIDERFDKLVMRFADGTPEELKGVLTKRAAWGCPADLLEENQKYLRKDLRYNLTARLLQPVLAGKPDGSFFAFIHGLKYGNLGLVVDPSGVTLGGLHPEEVALIAFNESKFGFWYAGHLLTEPRDGWHVKRTNHETGSIKAVNHKIDATIEKNGTLTATTSETFVSQIDDLRVVPFNLFQKLRVSRVTDANGNALGWIQEDKDEDAEYYVVLAKPAKKGEQVVVTSSYSGKDAVFREGDGNYYPVARHNWYPNTRLCDYAMYQVTFRIPKNLTMAATGTLISQRVEGNESITEWKSDVPLSVAGFNFGDFKSETAKLEKEGVQVAAFANRDIPDSFKRILDSVSSNTTFIQSEDRLHGDHVAALGSMSTTPMLKKSLAEAALAVELYTNYYGPMSYKNLEVTQQTSGSYGQAWPGLVFLPIYYFLDTTQRHQLHLDDLKSQYWKVVEPHEVAHEWWGHAVGIAGYRDNWISEGFADFSASLFIQYIRRDRGEYLQYWKDLRDQLLEKDRYGHRPIDVGSVTMGYRVSTSKVDGWTGVHVLYPKGAYILHMLRQMMYTQKTGDTDFKAMMHDLVDTYRNQPITTEDFKAIVEKHMTPAMDAAGNHKMDWFFDQWVYGTEVPSYSFESGSSPVADGKASITLKISQSGVSPTFKMVVPIYFEMADGKVGKLGQLLLTGNQTITQTVPFGTNVPKRLMINYNYDVLSTN